MIFKKWDCCRIVLFHLDKIFGYFAEFSISKLTGTETAGYVDGSLDKAKFNKPKSITVDSKGNIYVADIRNKHAIRKISKSGI